MNLIQVVKKPRYKTEKTLIITYHDCKIQDSCNFLKMGRYWEICWNMYSHRLIYPLWLVQGCGLFPSPSLSHKAQVCLPPGTLLLMWSVCRTKFKEYFDYLAQYGCHSELKLVCRATSISQCADGLWAYVTSNLIKNKNQFFKSEGNMFFTLHNSWSESVVAGECIHLIPFRFHGWQQ